MQRAHGGEEARKSRRRMGEGGGTDLGGRSGLVEINEASEALLHANIGLCGARTCSVAVSEP